MDPSLVDYHFLLRDFEIISSTGADLSKFLGGRTNLLVGNLEHVQDRQWTALEFIPCGISGAAASADYMTWDSLKALDTISMIWDVQQTVPSKDTMFWCLNVSCPDVDFPDEPFACDAETTMIPITPKTSEELRVFSFFGGGVGGWTYAINHLSAFHGVHAKTVLIDSDLQACASYCLNHQATVFDADHLPDNFEAVIGHGCALHGNAASLSWVPAIAKWNPHLVTLSSPCQPWSKASTCRGLASMDGMLFVEGLMQSRWLQPDVICLEQVSGFPSHDHKAMVLKVISMIGYAITWSKTSDLSHFAPVHRPRWLAVLRKVTEHMPCVSPTIRIPEADECTPESFQALFSFQTSLDTQLKISEDMRKIVQSHDFLPAAKKRKTNQTPLELRTIARSEKLPVIMAAYGSQHRFSLNTLRERGCLAHFIQDDLHGPRLLHPGEIAMLHGLMDRYFATADFTLAWKFLGNMIAPIHSLMTLQIALQVIPRFATIAKTINVFQTWSDHRLKTCQAILTKGIGGSFLRRLIWEEDLSPQQHAAIADFFQHHSKGFLPEGKCWNIHGFHDVKRKPHASQDPMAFIPFTDLPGSPVTPLQPTEASETQAFCMTLHATVHHPEWDQSFWFASDVQPNDLANLWHTSFRVEFQDGACHLYPQVGDALNTEHNLLPCIIDNRLTIYNAKDVKLKAFCAQVTAHDAMFDQFGPLADHQTFSSMTMVMSQPLKHVPASIEPLLLLAACQNTTLVFQYDLASDTWFGNFFGDQHSCKTVAFAFAQAIHKDSLHALGRSVRRVSFKPAELGNAVPPCAFSMCLAIALTRSFLDALTSPSGTPAEIKCWSRPIWSGCFDPNTTAEVIKALLMFALAPVLKLREVRLIHKAKQFASGPITQCSDAISATQPIKLHVGFELCGGVGPTSTKGQLKQQVRNSIASWMLERGIELTWIHQNLEKIIDDVGPKKIVPAIQQPASAKRDSQILQMIHDAKFQLPETPAKASPAIQKLKQRKRPPSLPDPCDFQVDCAFLLREDGQPTMQLQDIRPNATGVFLTNEAGAAPWIRDGQCVSADELGILVLGPLTIDTPLPNKQIVLPCVNADTQQVLLQLTLIQLGEKKLSCKDWDQTSTTATSSKICALTLWRQDWTDDEWNKAVEKTTLFLKDVLSCDGHQNALTSVWGRSFRKGKQPCQPHEATSIQVHAAIPDAQFVSFLKGTGHNRIWAAPKAESGRLTDDYRILWLQSNVELQKAATLTAKLAGVAGLVRGKSSLGIRIATGMFETAWKSLYPQEPVPIDASNKWIYKLEPLPYGCNHAMLLEWSQHVNWVFRPLRATGPKSWLVCTGSEPPAGPLAFNGHPVLPRLIQNRQQNNVQPILAGPRKQPTRGPSVPATNVAIGLNHDPWWRYTPLNGKANMQTAAPSNTGPQEQKFAQQEAKVQELEQKLEAMQTVQHAQGSQLAQISEDLAASESKITDKINASMLQVKNELAGSFGEALSLQSKQFEANFRDIKSMLMQTKRKNPAPAEEEMSD